MKKNEEEIKNELEKSHLAGLEAMYVNLRKNGVNKEQIKKFMDTFFHEIVNEKFINPSVHSSVQSFIEDFRVQIQSALSQVNKNKLKGFEALMRLDMRIDCPREEHTISEGEIRLIRICLEAGFNISEVARIFERSKSTISDIAHKKTHTTTDE